MIVETLLDNVGIDASAFVADAPQRTVVDKRRNRPRRSGYALFTVRRIVDVDAARIGVVVQELSSVVRFISTGVVQEARVFDVGYFKPSDAKEIVRPADLRNLIGYVYHLDGETFRTHGQHNVARRNRTVRAERYARPVPTVR